jgi:hypothetical protein
VPVPCKVVPPDSLPAIKVSLKKFPSTKNRLDLIQNRTVVAPDDVMDEIVTCTTIMGIRIRGGDRSSGARGSNNIFSRRTMILTRKLEKHKTDRVTYDSLPCLEPSLRLCRTGEFLTMLEK